MKNVNVNLDISEIKANIRKFKENEPPYLFQPVESIILSDLDEGIEFINREIYKAKEMEEAVITRLDQIKLDLAKNEITELNEYLDIPKVDKFIKDRDHILLIIEQSDYSAKQRELIELKQTILEKFLTLKMNLIDSNLLIDDEINLLIETIKTSNIEIAQVIKITSNPKEMIKVMKNKKLDELFNS